jgi:hypothetical protein
LAKFVSNTRRRVRRAKSCHQENSSWVYETGEYWSAIGFPTEITITWRDSRPSEDEQEFDISYNRWRDNFSFDPIKTQAFYSKSVQINPEMIETYLSFKKGSLVKPVNIEETITESKGNIYCKLSNNFSAQLLAESLSLLPIKTKHLFEGWQRRNYYVSSIQNWTLRGSKYFDSVKLIPPVQFVEKVGHQLIAEAYFIEIPIQGRNNTGKSLSILFRNPVTGKFSEKIKINPADFGDTQRIIRLYDKLIGIKNGENWTFHIDKREVFIAASWEIIGLPEDADINSFQWCGTNVKGAKPKRATIIFCQ